LASFWTTFTSPGGCGGNSSSAIVCKTYT
jgi:hypothetical protein